MHFRSVRPFEWIVDADKAQVSQFPVAKLVRLNSIVPLTSCRIDSCQAPVRSVYGSNVYHAANGVDTTFEVQFCAPSEPPLTIDGAVFCFVSTMLVA